MDRDQRAKLAQRLNALDPFALAIIEDEIERAEEAQREAERLGRDPTVRLN